MSECRFHGVVMTRSVRGRRRRGRCGVGLWRCGYAVVAQHADGVCVVVSVAQAGSALPAEVLFDQVGDRPEFLQHRC